MRYLDLTFAEPAWNLACDEALLLAAEQEGGTGLLRVWEPQDLFVVVGYGNRVEREADVAACTAAGIPILRRCSGGGAVLQGPGCLNYALVLDTQTTPGCAGISSTNRSIMERHRAGLEALLGRPVCVQGHTDLSVDGRKFSGNAQRRLRRWLLFHGTFLLGLDLERMHALLPFPSRAPAYRGGRGHAAFVCNLRLPPERMKNLLREVWQAELAAPGPSLDRLEDLVRTKYGRDEWNRKF